MKRISSLLMVLVLMFGVSTEVRAWDFSRLFQAGTKVLSAATLSDTQLKNYIHEYVEYQDKENKIAPDGSEYAVRLANLTKGLTDVNGTPLNFKVYITKDVNAFACADGSVRVYSGLMDLMTDDEVLGVIGHEIGHVAHEDTKKAFKNSLMVSALKDGIASSGGVAAALTDSQLGALSESLVNARYSQKQETNADDYGYTFLKSHGKNPWAMAQAFKKLGQLEGSSATNGMAQLFSSHPDTAKRIKNIEARCKKDKIDPPANYY